MDFHPKGALVRVVLIGDSAVGKTSIINRLVNNTFNSKETTTIGATFLLFSQRTETDAEIELQIWDTAGQEKFRSLGPIYYRDSSACVAVFDLTSRKSFEDLNYWISTFKSIAGNDTVVAVAGNKCDMDGAAVSIEEASEYCRKNGYIFFPTSAKSGENVNELFKKLSGELVRYSKKLAVEVMDPPQEQNQRKKCC